MRRIGVRIVMTSIGVMLLIFYLSAALLAYQALTMLWRSRPDPTTAIVIVGVFTIAFGYLSYRFGTARLIASLDALELPREHAPGVYRRLDRLCERTTVAPPKLLIARLSAPNALAIGGGRNAIVLDAMLLRLLDADELEAVLAHELAHLESRDSLIQTLAYTAVRTVVGVANLFVLPIVLLLTGVARAVAWIAGRPTAWPHNPIGRVRLRLGQLIVLVLVMLTLVVFAHSRRREYAADDRAVAITGNPMALARALAKIQRASDPSWRLRSPLYIHGDEEGILLRLLSTHPSMDDRIDRLIERANRRPSPVSGTRPGIRRR